MILPLQPIKNPGLAGFFIANLKSGSVIFGQIFGMFG